MRSSKYGKRRNVDEHPPPRWRRRLCGPIYTGKSYLPPVLRDSISIHELRTTSTKSKRWLPYEVLGPVTVDFETYCSQQPRLVRPSHWRVQGEGVDNVVSTTFEPCIFIGTSWMNTILSNKNKLSIRWILSTYPLNNFWILHCSKPSSFPTPLVYV